MTMQHHEKTVAAKLVLSAGDLLLRSIPIIKESISVGRRPYNDIALDDLTVSGEHALIQGRGTDFVVRDLRSGDLHTEGERIQTCISVAVGDCTLDV